MRFRFDGRLGEIIETDLFCSVAAAIAGAAVVGAAGSAISSSNAASAQENAANQANQTQLQMYNQEQQNLQPYMNEGLNALGTLQSGTADLNSPLLASFQPTEAQLEATPGYQFNLSQGLKAVQNSATANGLGVSGNALAGAAQYATGLADSTYQQQFSNYVTNQTNQYNRLLSLAQLGQNSAAGVGAAGIQTGSNIGSNLVGAGNAAAASSVGVGNALSNGANGIAGAYLTNQLLSQNTYDPAGGYGNTNGNMTYNQFIS